MTTENDVFNAANLREQQFIDFQLVCPVATVAYQGCSTVQWGTGYTPPTSGKANGRVCTKTSVGALPFTAPPGSKHWFLKGATFVANQSAAANSLTIYIVDRLAEVQLLLAETSGAITGCDASGKLGSTAGRGDGALIYAEACGASLGTSTTLSLGYTSQVGTGSRSTGSVSSLASQVQGGPFTATTPFLPFQAGDWGARSIDSITAVSGSGTGNILVSLVKVLGEVSMSSQGCVSERDFCMEFPIMQRVRDDAFLQFIVIGQTTFTASNASLLGTLELVALS